MTARGVHVVVPGSLDQRTGGYLYDARVVKGLRARGWDVTVHELSGRFPGPDDQAVSSLARTLDGLPDRAWVIIDGLAMGASPEAVCPHARRLVIISLVHHPLAEETGLSIDERQRYRRLETEALGSCAGVIVTSPFTAAALERYAVRPVDVRVVPPGVDPVPLALGAGAGAPAQMLCVASVTPRKGHDVLVRALDRLSSTRWRLVCAGSLTRAPRYADGVQALVRQHGLSGRVTFTGELDRAGLDRLYDTSTIFVLPSYYEGYGMVLTEALARGLPVVSTTGGAIPETVPAEASILVPPGDEVALSEALAAVLVPARLAALTAAARRVSATLPGWEQTISSFEGALLDVASRRSAAAAGHRSERGHER